MAQARLALQAYVVYHCKVNGLAVHFMYSIFPYAGYISKVEVLGFPTVPWVCRHHIAYSSCILIKILYRIIAHPWAIR